jgi:hypothetical protein
VGPRSSCYPQLRLARHPVATARRETAPAKALRLLSSRSVHVRVADPSEAEPRTTAQCPPRSTQLSRVLHALVGLHAPLCHRRRQHRDELAAVRLDSAWRDLLTPWLFRRLRRPGVVGRVGLDPTTQELRERVRVAPRGLRLAIAAGQRRAGCHRRPPNAGWGPSRPFAREVARRTGRSVTMSTTCATDRRVPGSVRASDDLPDLPGKGQRSPPMRLMVRVGPGSRSPRTTRRSWTLRAPLTADPAATRKAPEAGFGLCSERARR